MTNRERIAEMKVVDYFKKYAYDDENDFNDFVCASMRCKKCDGFTREKNCKEILIKWLDKEVSE
ncbi:MAG: hypothetical protein II574_04120 [Ruminococcus sp.]|nr:hypothetical protein [Ruminococcus sp.]